MFENLQRGSVGAIFGKDYSGSMIKCRGKYLELTVEEFLNKDLEILARGMASSSKMSQSFMICANPELVPGSANLCNYVEACRGTNLATECSKLFGSYIRSLSRRIAKDEESVPTDAWIFRMYGLRFGG